MCRAIPSPGPLWRGLRIFCLAPPLAGVSPFLHHELSLVVVMSFQPVLRALLHSFQVSSPSRAVRPPPWAFAVFLRRLPSSSFASLHSTPLAYHDGSLLCGLSDGLPSWRASGTLPLFFISLRWRLSVICPYICCHVWVAPCSIPRSFLVISLSVFAAGLDVCPLLCPVRALRIFLDRTASV